MNFKSIINNSRGQVLVIAAISLLVILGVTALAIDLGIAYAVKTKINSAVDSAAIAAARMVKFNDSASDAQTAARNFFNANFPANFMGSINTTVTPTANHNSDGSWTINVSATTLTPTYFGRIFGQTGTTVGASAEAISRTLDVMLVLDLSDSLVMTGSVSDLKTAASNFLDVFSVGDDRVGMVLFESGAIIPANCAINNPARGFNRTTLKSAITSAVAGGYTNSAEAMRIARAEMNAIPAIQRGSLRVIVFFSDGLPNTANFNLGTSVSPINRGSAVVNFPPRPYDLNFLDHANNSPPSFPSFPSLDNHIRSDISSLDTQAEADANSVDLATYNPGFRQITFNVGGRANYDECNINKAARSQLEFFADQARAEGIIIYSIGLGGMGDVEEHGCGYTVANESGGAILRRIAASPGVFVNASDHSQLNSAFQSVAKMILRLTR